MKQLSINLLLMQLNYVKYLLFQLYFVIQNLFQDLKAFACLVP